MAVYELNAAPAIESINQLTSSVRKTGQELDALALSRSLTTGINSIDRLMSDLENSTKLSRTELDNLGSAFKTLRFTGESAITGIAAAQQSAYITLKAYTEQSNVLHSVLKDTDTMKAQIATQRTINTLHEKAVGNTQVLAAQTELLSTAEGKAAANAAIRNKSVRDQVTSEAQLEASQAKTLTRLQQLDTELGKNAAASRVLAQGKENLATAGTKVEVTLQQQAQRQRQLNDANYTAAANNKILLTALERNKTQYAQMYAESIKLAGAKELENSAIWKQVQAQKAEAAEREKARSAKQDDLRYYERKTKEVSNLKRELEYLGTAEAKQAALLQQQVNSERKALTNSTEASVKKNSQLRIGNQLTAAMRASLAGLKTSIGMYTSSTIIAASATYALMRAIRSTITTGAEFQATMARTQAIMGSSVPAAMRSEVFKAMEDQIRSLGKSTQFTATEVASAMTELGQAGLTAGDAIIALAPTLDLSIIGQLEMARAADHVTNIMMIFGKEASDLSDIVDVLATAVTNSNTNIDQLANALTYAGPAAETAGFSFRETVASLEALANAGFKSNRSGTALRRLFVSLSNPTAKAKAVMDDLNLSVTNLDGKTFSLVGIISQLKTSMAGLGETEQLAAIQDLVGVYASSPIAALVKQADSLRHLQHQLHETGGAASEMRKQMEAALKFDFKTALSAFQEAQLTVFSGMEIHLQSITISAAEWLSELTRPLEEGGVVTQLDIIVQRFLDISTAIGYAGAAWGASKLITMVGSFGVGLRNSTAASLAFAKSLSLQNAALVKSTYHLRLNALAHSAANKGMVAGGAAIHTYAGAMAWAATATKYATTAVIGLTRAIPLLGVAWVAYEAFNTFFGDSAQQKVLDKRDKVDALAQSYLSVKNNIDEAAAAEARAAASKQAGLMQKSLDITRGERDEWVEIRNQLAAADLPTSLADAEIAAKERQMNDLAGSIRNLNKDVRESHKLNKTTRQQLEVELLVLQAMIDGQYEYGDSVKAQEIFQRNLAEQKAKIVKLLQSETELEEALLSLRSKANLNLKDNQASFTEDHRISQLSDVEKYDEALQATYKKAVEWANFLNSLPDKGLVSEQDNIQLSAMTKELGELQEALFKAQMNVENFSASFEDSMEQMAFLYMTEEEKQDKLTDDLREIIELRALNIRTMLEENSAAAGTMAYQAMLAESAKEELRIRTQLAGIARSQNRGGSNERPGNSDRELEQQLSASLSTYDSLRQKYDQVGVSQDQMAASTEQLNLLVEHGKKTTEEISHALQQLHTDHMAVVSAADSHTVAANRLAEAYLKSGNDKAINDLVALEEAYKNTNMSAERYRMTREAILESTRVQDLPKTEMPTSNDSGPFGDVLTSVITHSATTEDLANRKDDFMLAYEQQLEFMKQQEELDLQNAEQSILNEQDRLDKMEEIRKNYRAQDTEAERIHKAGLADIATAEVKHSVDSQRLIMASMAGSLSSLLGMIGDASEDASASQKAAFVASKALAVAQIILNTHVAASNASRQEPYFLGMSLYTATMAQGYASAGMVAAMAIGQLGGSDSSSDFAGAFDKGGYIPTGKHGIVGEYGPEIVNGPAHVTGREATARKLNRNSETPAMSLTTEINIDYHSTGDSKPEDFRALGQMVENTVISTVHTMLRPNGLLYRSQN